MAFNVAYSKLIYTNVWHFIMVILKPVQFVCTLEHTPVLWCYLETPCRAGNYLRLDIGNVFVLLGRRILDGKQGLMARSIRALFKICLLRCRIGE